MSLQALGPLCPRAVRSGVKGAGEVQPEKQLSPISSTLAGSSRSRITLQPANAKSPMRVTPSGIVTAVRPVQLENAEDGAAIKSAVSVFKQDLVRKRIFTPLKLLAVGNSWSSNATNHLPMIMESLGKCSERQLAWMQSIRKRPL